MIYTYTHIWNICVYICSHISPKEPTKKTPRINTSYWTGVFLVQDLNLNLYIPTRNYPKCQSMDCKINIQEVAIQIIENLKINQDPKSRGKQKVVGPLLHYFWVKCWGKLLKICLNIYFQQSSRK